MSYRETLRAQLDTLGLDRRVHDDVDRALSKAAIVAMVREGFTVGMAAEALGIPESTARSWAKSDPEFEAAVSEANEQARGWLLGQLVRIVQKDETSRAAGQALNILANLRFPELRVRKVQASITGAPDPDRSRANLDALLARGD